jgi:hypothetical protein
MSYDKAKDDERRAAEARREQETIFIAHNRGGRGIGALAALALAATVGIAAGPSFNGTRTGRFAARHPALGMGYGTPSVVGAVKRAHGIDPDGPLGQALTLDYSEVEARALATFADMQPQALPDTTRRPQRKFKHNRRG